MFFHHTSKNFFSRFFFQKISIVYPPQKVFWLEPPTLPLWNFQFGFILYFKKFGH